MTVLRRLKIWGRAEHAASRREILARPFRTWRRWTKRSVLMRSKAQYLLDVFQTVRT
jgi:hypothetical protein